MREESKLGGHYCEVHVVYLGKMNPNNLLRGELVYELLVTGISSDSDFHTLCKLFRAVVTDKVPCNVRNLTTHSVEELFESIYNKAVEIQNNIKQQEGSCSSNHLVSERVSGT